MITKGKLRSCFVFAITMFVALFLFVLPGYASDLQEGEERTEEAMEVVSEELSEEVIPQNEENIADLQETVSQDKENIVDLQETVSQDYKEQDTEDADVLQEDYLQAEGQQDTENKDSSQEAVSDDEVEPEQCVSAVPVDSDMDPAKAEVLKKAMIDYGIKF